MQVHVSLSATAVLPAGCTAHDALNASLPEANIDGAFSSAYSSAKPGRFFTPTEVLPWCDAEPGSATEPLDQAILTFQGDAQHQNVR